MNLDWVQLSGGQFPFGSDDFYPEEAPAQVTDVQDFEIMRGPVTESQFWTFVEETGYVTVAEREVPAEEFPELNEAERIPGSLVFQQTSGPVNLDDWRQWWAWVPGANWRRPNGIQRESLADSSFPVTQVAYDDALAFCNWVGGRLPTEKELEYASRGGSPARTAFAWGHDRNPGGLVLANTWYGKFPYLNVGALGWKGPSPVGAFPRNGYGLFDTIGNVWEWTSTIFSSSHLEAGESGCGCGCSPQSATSAQVQRVLKGGSFLCAPEYCLRYRPSARTSQTEDSSTNHIGFRCVR